MSVSSLHAGTIVIEAMRRVVMLFRAFWWTPDEALFAAIDAILSGTHRSNATRCGALWH